MKRRSFFIAALTLILGFATTSYADIYATNVEVSATVIAAGATNSTVEISFLLNEASDSGVDVKIYSGATLARTITLATAPKGTNSVSWDGTDDAGITVADGDYTFEVVASDDGNTAWTKISDDLLTVMYSPKGISVNRNLDSPNFGTVYISNGYAGTSGNTGGVYNGDGIYLFSAAQDSLAFSDGGVDWSGSSNTPGKTSIGSDDRIYVTEYSTDEIYVFDGMVDPASGFRLLDGDNKVTDQYVVGNWVTGSGADRAIYTADGHYITGQGIVKYTIGTEDTLLLGNVGELVVERPNGDYYQRDVEVDSQGNIYFCQMRADPNQAYPLLKYPPYTGTTLTIADTLWAVPMTYTGAQGIALDEANNRIAWGSYYSGTVYIHDLTTGALLETIATGQSRTQDLAFDAAGNLYTIDNGSEYWHVWSSPDGANSFTTPGRDTLLVHEMVPDLFFSEYVEGSNSNKALEIYNPTDAAIDLSNYYVVSSSNEATDWEYSYEFPDTAKTIAAQSTYVIVDASAWDEVKVFGNWIASWPSPVGYNGNDGLGLMKRVGTQSVLLDVIGEANNPDGLYYTVAGVADGMKDYTLVRKEMTMGNPDWTTSSGTDAASSEWAMFPQNTFMFLGAYPNDIAGPEITSIEAASTTQLQLRFDEPVVSADALVLSNYSISGGIGNPTAVSMLNEFVYLLDIAAITPNTPYTLTVDGIHDMIGNAIMDNYTIKVNYDRPSLSWRDQTRNDFVSDVGNWAHPTYSGSTSGILGTSTFAPSDSLAFEGSNSGEMVLLDDPAVTGGWFVRLWNLSWADKIQGDSRLFFYLRGGNADMQIRIVVKDDDGYEAGAWHDITYAETDWQVISLDLANDPVTGWITGNGSINADGTLHKVSLESIQIKCSEDVSTTLFIDMVTERYSVGAGLVSNAGTVIPVDFALHNNYPNPFNPITNIKYDIPENTYVNLAIYNMLGHHVIDLVNEEQAPGFYHLQWNGLNKFGAPVSSGLYIYRITTPGFSKSGKMTYLK